VTVTETEDGVRDASYGGQYGGDAMEMDTSTDQQSNKFTPPSGAPLVTFADEAKDALTYELSHLSKNCEKVLPTAQLKTNAADLSFWDGRGSLGNVLASAIPGVVEQGTIGQAVGSNYAKILSGPEDTISPEVVLGQSFFQKNSAGQGITLLHELLHYTTQMGDKKFYEAYGIQSTDGDGYSSAISTWLIHDCKN